MEKAFIATGNKGKYREMKPRFNDRGLELERIEVDIHEIHAPDVEDVARQKAIDSYRAAEASGKIPEDATLLVEDTGFYVEALDGFPGAEAAFFAGTAGVEKLLKLLEDEDDRKAYFKTAVAVIQEGEVEVFTGKMNGRIPQKKKGESHPHLPYNSYFIPEGEEKTLAQDQELKQGEFHRNKATDKLLKHLK